MALPAAAQEASQTTVVTGAGQGIFVNDGSDSACSEYTDNDGVSNLASDVHCLTNDKATQTNRVLFYNPRGSVGATSLTLGGELYVNSGNFGLGGGQTGSLANSMRIGGATTLATTNSGTNSIAIGGASNATTALGSDSVAVGSSANAQSANGVAIGNTANAQSTNDIAIGDGAVANANIGNLGTANNISALAVGNAAQAYGNNATALGINAIAGNNNGSTKQGLALGAFTGAFGDQSTAIGNNAQSMGNSSIAIGGDDVDKVANTTYTVSINGQNVTNTGANLFTLVTGSNAIAAGAYHAPQAGDSSVALGPQAQAGWSNSNIYPTLQGAAGGTGAGGSPTGEFDVAIGTQANAQGFSSIAMGTGAIASADTSVAMGVNARASGVESIAFGTSTSASQNYAVAIGNGGTTGATYTKAAGIGALAIGGNNAAGAIAAAANAIALGGQSSVGTAGTSGIAVGRGATVNGAFGIAQGDGITSGATGQNVAIGSSGTTANATTSAGGAVAIGMGQSATGNGAVAIGDPNTVNGNGAVAMGANNSAANSVNGLTAASGAVAIGNGNKAIGQGSVALGNSSNAAAAGALAFGDTAVAQAAAGVALGSGATATNTKDVALGAGSSTGNISAGSYTVIAGNTTAPAGTPSQVNGVVSVGSVGHERQIQNVAAGTLSSTSTDAVNGSQLYAVGTQVNTTTTNLNNLGTDTASYLGGGATYNSSTGTMSAPSYAIGSGTYHDVGTAFAAVNTDLNGLSNGTAGIVQRTANSNQVVFTASGGTSSNPGAAQNVTNVAAGTLSSTSTDAVNGSQLYAVGTQVNTTTANLNNLGANTASYLGGGAVYNSSTGTVSAPSYAIGGSTYNNVGAAFAAVNTDLNGLSKGTAGIVQRTSNSNQVVLTASGGTSSNPGAAQNLTNVAAGTLSSTSTDAVNGSQLYATNQTIGNLTDGKVGAFQSDNSAAAAQPVASGANATAGGFGASATGNASAVIGNSATDNGVANSTVLGEDASIAANTTGSNVALGQGSQVTHAATPVTSGTIDGTSYAYAGATPAGVMSVGTAGNERQITNVAAGQITAGSTDAVNGSQLYATNQALSQLDSEFASITSGGGNIKYLHVNSTLTDSQANGANSTAIGPVATTGKANAVAIGNGATASANDGDVALGSGSTTSAVVATSSVTVGDTTYAVAGASPTSTVSVGSFGDERTIINVAAGQITATSTDAVNGSELYATNQAVNANTANINTLNSELANITNGNNGMFQSSNGGNQPAPAATGSNSAAGGAGSAASGDNSLAVGNGSTASGSNSTAVGADASATASNSVAIGANSVADRANSVSVGSAGNNRQVTNVAAGTAATDAANVGQLNAVQAASVHYDTNADGSIDYDSITLGAPGSPSTVHNVAAGTAPTDAVNVGQLQQGMQNVQNWAKSYTDQAVDHMGRQAFAGVASAIASANLPQAYQANQSSAGVGLGNFHGQSAISVGVSTISESGRWIFKANASSDTRGDAGVGVGAGIVW